MDDLKSIGPCVLLSYEQLKFDLDRIQANMEMHVFHISSIVMHE